MRSLLLVTLLLGCGSDSNDTIDAPRAIDASTTDAAVAINGCRAAQVMDRSAAGADRTITFGGVLGERYSPPCIKIALGQSVTWNGTFSDHPMVPGIRASGEQDNNPIPRSPSGTTRNATFNTAGAWGYYCTSHPGMEGVVFVE